MFYDLKQKESAFYTFYRQTLIILLLIMMMIYLLEREEEENIFSYNILDLTDP